MGGTDCEKLIRVVNTPVSWWAVRDERDVSHDEGPAVEVVVPLRQWGWF